jgi:hypothetical protein
MAVNVTLLQHKSRIMTTYNPASLQINRAHLDGNHAMPMRIAFMIAKNKSNHGQDKYGAYEAMKYSH